MRMFYTTLLLMLCLILFSTGTCIAGFRVAGETKGFYYSIIWDKWFEVPLWVYVDSRKLFFIGGGSVVRATAAFPYSVHSEMVLLLEKALDEVDKAREMGTVSIKELGSVKALIDKELNHFNGIDVYLAEDRTGQSSDIHLKIYDYMSPQNVTEITLARNHLQDLINILNTVPETIRFLEIDEKMMRNTNELNLGTTSEDHWLEEINKVRF
jgi:flagellin-specific chaperone FliS